jgi:hypothetical protein
VVKAKICEFVGTQSGPPSLRRSTFTGARARRPLGYQIEREQYLQPGRRADTVISISEMTLEFTLRPWFHSTAQTGTDTKSKGDARLLTPSLRQMPAVE